MRSQQTRPTVALMLARRLRRRSNIKTTSGKRLVFAGTDIRSSDSVGILMDYIPFPLDWI